MEETRKLPIGIQSFEDLRLNNYLYADKTEYIEKLLMGKSYFLSRPRRFGKSLFLSTLKAYFEGRKELFTGLKIAESEKEWKKYPVFYFDFNGKSYVEKDALRNVLDEHLKTFEKEYGKTTTSNEVDIRFGAVIRAACKKTGLQVVVLVDEYDKSLLENDGEQKEANRALFKGFFGNLKACDEYLKFVFITGVTKFTKVSIFSDLNQLQDISLDKRFSSICGITEEEIVKNFEPYISALAEENDFTREECLKKLERMYDGYHFSRKMEGVYNPFSLLNTFEKREFSNYWFETGTPSFLIKKLRKADLDYKDFSRGVNASAYTLSDYRDDNPDPVPLFYQTGYLTIKEYKERHDIYVLRYPNDEVKYSFINSLVPSVLNVENVERGLNIMAFDDDIASGNIKSMMQRFSSLFASLPYTSLTEKNKGAVIEQNFQNVIYIVFTLLGKWSRVEEYSALGRADCVLETEDKVYIFEFKRDGSLEEAFNQIEEKAYAEKYKASGKAITKIAVNFSSQKRNIAEWDCR
ncbi:MAG: ATP-binding protein [Treponemataceae bacterium]|nr:ATP-binding protein [Treponemataceae bacterium]